MQLTKSSHWNALSDEEQLESIYNIRQASFGVILCPIAIAVMFHIQLPIFGYSLFAGLAICIFNIFLGFRGKNDLATALAIITFTCIYSLSKWFYPSLAFEFLMFPFCGISVLVLKDKTKKIVLPFVILSSIFVLIAEFITPLKFEPTFLQEKLVYYSGMLISIIILSKLLFEFGKHQSILKEKLKTKNSLLVDQQEEIRLQHDAILKYEKEKYNNDLTIKQKDLEFLQEINKMKVKFRLQTIEKLRAIMKGGEYQKDVRSLVFDLEQQSRDEQRNDRLQENLDVVNSDFYIKLDQNFPSLSMTEREICSYIKLGLSSKEMAVLRNTSVNAINVTKTRIKKKVGFDDTTEFAKYLMAL
ncbi:helix-turn-helix transcriptional regulator [Flammeovirga agarivorans]|uniref:HTH luxR-type domain-containing protein n=1 Tax=Flammeovirga agarivorans TaxID=2726742 RepID=A0A7X8XVP2_9BACT|nr:hypothetical protein [Flammeovirga agarivorans]NLR91532.1 hypothetical protein [Flammeovirga agarivorans]